MFFTARQKFKRLFKFCALYWRAVPTRPSCRGHCVWGCTEDVCSGCVETLYREGINRRANRPLELRKVCYAIVRTNPRIALPPIESVLAVCKVALQFRLFNLKCRNYSISASNINAECWHRFNWTPRCFSSFQFDALCIKVSIMIGTGIAIRAIWKNEREPKITWFANLLIQLA